MKQLIISFLILLTVASCDQSEDSEIIKKGEEVELTFSLDIPEALEVTNGLKAFDQNSVRSIDLLMFNQSNQFMQRIKVNNVTGIGATKNFSVRLQASAQARTFHIIANGRDENGADLVNMSSVTANMTEAVAIPALKTNTLAASTSPQLPLVMWGRASLTSVTATSSFGTIPMLRTAAAIGVECVTATTVNGLDKFSLTGMTVLQTNNMGKVAPAAYTTPAATPAAVSLIVGSAYIDYVNASGVGVWATAAANKTTSDLYVYERTNVLTTAGLSVIIRAKYNGVDGFYKIWLANAAGQVMHIVRNHRYLIQITKVYGPGYTTFAEAKSAAYSSNIFINIIDNNDDITDIIVDGKYELGTSSNAVTITGSGVNKGLGTILNTNTAATATATSNVAWINNIVLTGSGTRRTMTATLATTTVSRTGVVTVQAGSLARTITVTQKP